MTAAQLLAAGWIVSVSAWRWVGADYRELCYGALDIVLASTFFFMSRGRWFPAPLFFIHAVLVLYDLYAFFVGSPTPWVSAFVNRFYELALAYVGACALFRIKKGRPKEKARHVGRALIRNRIKSPD